MKLKPCPFCGGTRIKTRRLSEMLDCPHTHTTSSRNVKAATPAAPSASDPHPQALSGINALQIPIQ
jgi:hypothetical protein